MELPDTLTNGGISEENQLSTVSCASEKDLLLSSPKYVWFTGEVALFKREKKYLLEQFLNKNHRTCLSSFCCWLNTDKIDKEKRWIGLFLKK